MFVAYPGLLIHPLRMQERSKHRSRAQRHGFTHSAVLPGTAPLMPPEVMHREASLRYTVPLDTPNTGAVEAGKHGEEPSAISNANAFIALLI